MIQEFTNYFKQIENLKYRNRVDSLFCWIMERFPTLVPKIAWHQPMFTDHGTFIIGFSIAKNHLAVAPERITINHFLNEIHLAGYRTSKELIQIRWDEPIHYSLLERIIEYNITEKADCPTFWRK